MNQLEHEVALKLDAGSIADDGFMCYTTAPSLTSGLLKTIKSVFNFF